MGGPVYWETRKHELPAFGAGEDDIMRLGGLQGIWENLYVIWSVTPRASKDLVFDHGNGSEMNKACIQCVFISTLLLYSCSNHVESYSKTILVCFAYSIDVLILHPKLRFLGHPSLRPNVKHFDHTKFYNAYISFLDNF